MFETERTKGWGKSIFRDFVFYERPLIQRT